MTPALKKSFSSTPVKIAFLFSVYFITARVGLSLDTVNGFATLIWPPSGIALWAILTYGTAVWPGIALGAFFANYSLGAPLFAAIGISIGNTLEAVLAAYLLTHILGFKNSFDRLKDALGFILLAAFLSTIVGATFGVTSLYLTGIVTPEKIAATWNTWWLGDAMGDLIFGTFLLTWSQPNQCKSGARLLEFVALLASFYVTAMIVFGAIFMGSPFNCSHMTYILFPPLIWGSLRYCVRGSATGTLMISLIATRYTYLGMGPFCEGPLNNRFFELQIFMGIISMTSLILSSAIAERNQIREDLEKSKNHLKSEVLKKTEELSSINKEIKNDIIKQKRAEEFIRLALKEKDILLKEVNHRVKNNLQVIASLINLQSTYVKHPLTREVLQESQNRIKTISYIHEKLYESSNVSNVDFGDYILRLCRYLFESYSIDESRIRLEIQVEKVYISPDSATPCGLIVNELVSNSLKHAFRIGDEGTISVAARKEKDNHLRLSVKDTGKGFPGNIDYKHTDSLGLQLVNLLTEQLEGSIEMRTDGGTEFIITFPIIHPVEIVGGDKNE